MFPLREKKRELRDVLQNINRVNLILVFTVDFNFSNYSYN